MCNQTNCVTARCVAVAGDQLGPEEPPVITGEPGLTWNVHRRDGWVLLSSKQDPAHWRIETRQKHQIYLTIYIHSYGFGLQGACVHSRCLQTDRAGNMI